MKKSMIVTITIALNHFVVNAFKEKVHIKLSLIFLNIEFLFLNIEFFFFFKKKLLSFF